MDRYGKNGMINEMESVLSGMKSTCVPLNGMTLEADLLFENSHKTRVTPDSLTYKLLYKAHTKANMKELVQKLLKCMEQNGMVPNKRSSPAWPACFFWFTCIQAT
ncbi:hypothetical protein WN943_023822 [Citrus x changshan-huyou]